MVLPYWNYYQCNNLARDQHLQFNEQDIYKPEEDKVVKLIIVYEKVTP